MPKVTIKVTQDHIDAARFVVSETALSLSLYCPLALAFADAGYNDAVVYLDVVRLRSSVKRVTLPKAAYEFRKAFDYKRDVRPFKFDIELPW